MPAHCLHLVRTTFEPRSWVSQAVHTLQLHPTCDSHPCCTMLRPAAASHKQFAPLSRALYTICASLSCPAFGSHPGYTVFEPVVASRKRFAPRPYSVRGSQRIPHAVCVQAIQSLCLAAASHMRFAFRQYNLCVSYMVRAKALQCLRLAMVSHTLFVPRPTLACGSLLVAASRMQFAL